MSSDYVNVSLDHMYYLPIQLVYLNRQYWSFVDS